MKEEITIGGWRTFGLHIWFDWPGRWSGRWSVGRSGGLRSGPRLSLQTLSVILLLCATKSGFSRFISVFG